MNENQDENINLTILNEINKAAKMGMDSITFVTEKIGDPVMKENLSFQYAEYGKVLDRVNTEFEKYGEIPDDDKLTDKMMSFAGVQFNTITDKSNSHIAEMMIQGNTMGIIESQKLSNHNPYAEESVKMILNDLMIMQQNNIEKMKTFL